MGIRPTSPHLSAYRWQVFNVLSMGHRFSGMGLAIGIVYLAAWLVCVMSGPEAYDAMMAWNGSFIGTIIMALFVAAGTFHFYAGIRHMIWDTGAWLDVQSIDRTSYWLIAITAVTWAIIMYVALQARGIL